MTPVPSISTFLAPPSAVNRKENGMTVWARRLVAILLMAPSARIGPAAESTGGDPALRPGDVLRINVWRHPELSGDFVVAPDSTLVDPVYQVVKVAGHPCRWCGNDCAPFCPLMSRACRSFWRLCSR